MNRLKALYLQYKRASSFSSVSRIADIGADHGYLSKKILDSGFKGRIIITDIAEMPLEVAKRNIGVDARVEYRLCDGLRGDFSECELVFIAGMGGDLIGSMIREAKDLREDVVLVLQPMTNFEKTLSAVASRYLYSFFANEKDKHYRILVASKRGELSAATAFSKTESKESGGLISVPWLFDFDRGGLGKAEEGIGTELFPPTENILIENVEDAILFFSYKLEQAKKISRAVSSIPDLYEHSLSRERQIEWILQSLAVK